MITPEIEGINHPNGYVGLTFGVSGRHDWKLLSQGHFMVFDPDHIHSNRILHFGNVKVEEVYGADLFPTERMLLNLLIFNRWLPRPFYRIRLPYFGNTWLYIGDHEWYTKMFGNITWDELIRVYPRFAKYPELRKRIYSWRRPRPHRDYQPRSAEDMAKSKKEKMSQYRGLTVGVKTGEWRGQS